MFDLKPFKKKNEDFFERMVESFNEERSAERRSLYLCA